jgi:hypothetical protein
MEKIITTKILIKAENDYRRGVIHYHSKHNVQRKTRKPLVERLIELEEKLDEYLCTHPYARFRMSTRLAELLEEDGYTVVKLGGNLYMVYLD